MNKKWMMFFGAYLLVFSFQNGLFANILYLSGQETISNQDKIYINTDQLWVDNATMAINF